MTTDEPARLPPSWPDTSALDLEDLLDELRARASASRRAQDRMRELLDAVVAVSADLDLAEVLTRIVHSATSLVEARYGALGVLSASGEHLVEFITRGVSDEERAQIGDPPKGHGLLGLLIREPHPRRVRDISQHPDSFGFPANHPPMHSFLGAPVRIRNDVFGNLYMAEKQGAQEFTPDDEAVLVALAAAAGVAIDNARLYDAARLQRRWSEAVNELTQPLLVSQDEDAALHLMAHHAASLSRGSQALVALYDEDYVLVVKDLVAVSQASTEPDGVRAQGAVLAAAQWAEVRQARQPILLASSTVTSPQEGLRADLSLIGLAARSPIALIPLAPGHGDLGILIVAWDEGGEELPAESMPALTTFALQAGLALLAGRAQRDRARMALFDDRDRIARDMHDHVIQRLFATGLSLQSAARAATHPVVRARLEEAVDDIDAAIKEIRHAIFELHQPIVNQTPQEELDSLVASFVRALGFEPELAVQGPLADLNPSLRSDVLAVVREGLSNVARHAHASRTQVTLLIDAAAVTVEICDDGVGVDRHQARSGLVNLGERAAASSGRFDVQRANPTGTRLRWHVPLPTD